MSDYGTMIRRINDECAWPQVVARIPNAIQAALRHYEGERFWFNETESTASTVASQQAYAMPSDFLEAESLTLTNSDIKYPLKKRPWSWMRQFNIDTTVTAQPWNWSYFADQIYLYPVPDIAYTLTISYLKRLSAPSGLTGSSAWFTHGEALIRRRAEADLAAHPTVKDMDAHAIFSRLEDQEHRKLRMKSEQKLSAGRMSFDPMMTAGQQGYNINYQ